MKGLAGRRGCAAAVVALGLLVARSATATAQILPPGWLGPAPTTTTTTAPEAHSPSGAPPGGGGSGSTGHADGDGGTGPSLSAGDGRVVPAGARAAIDAIVRSAPNDNHALVEGASALEALGVPHDEAVRAAFGRFPVLGPARWVDDWHFPRWTGSTFRFHLGLDVFADYGTAVAAPAGGIARIGSNPLGGVTVRVVEPDGTAWYLAHLSAVAAGLADGAPVAVGEVVGYVGDSGNARGGAPHLHLGLYLPGGDAAPPKPSVDAWVAEGSARVAELLATAAPVERADALSVTFDGNRRALEEHALALGWQQSADRARQLLAPLVNPALLRAADHLRP